jgi:hypothetical protein
MTFLMTIFMFVFSPGKTLGQLGCDSSYPDVCIPSYPPDLNCPDIADDNFRVLSPDPHGFDQE